MAEAKMIEYRVDNGVAVLEINRPPVNSYTTELLKELDAAVLDARFDDNVHAIVVTGKPEKFFSAGADINMLSSKSLAFKNNFALYGHEVLMRLENTPKIIIAAINGHAVGGGLEIAMACDLRIAKKEGGKVGLAEINLGVMPGMGGTQRLPRLVGKAHAMELCVTGKTIAFEEALEIGLIHYIYEREKEEGDKKIPFVDQVLDYARQFSVPNKSSLAVGKVKRAIQTGLELSLPEGLAFERELLAQTFGSEDGQEGVKAYLEKRTAQFKGK
jgi:enoyl-CoA hydratase